MAGWGIARVDGFSGGSRTDLAQHLPSARTHRHTHTPTSTCDCVCRFANLSILFHLENVCAILFVALYIVYSGFVVVKMGICFDLLSGYCWCERARLMDGRIVGRARARCSCYFTYKCCVFVKGNSWWSLYIYIYILVDAHCV